MENDPSTALRDVGLRMEAVQALLAAGMEPGALLAILASPACACRAALAINEAKEASDWWRADCSDDLTGSFYQFANEAVFVSWIVTLVNVHGRCYLVVFEDKAASQTYAVELLLEEPTFAPTKLQADQELVASLAPRSDFKYWRELIAEDHPELRLIPVEDPARDRRLEVLRVESVQAS